MKKDCKTRGWIIPVIWYRMKKILIVMKLSLLIILLSLFSAGASVYSQNSKLNLDYTNVSLKEVLGAIEDQSEYRFAFSSEYLDLDRKVSVRFENEPVTGVLDNIFRGTGIRYKLNDRMVILYKDEAGANKQQQITVSGKVTDSSGTPLPGVTVVIKSTTKGIITNVDGIYTLTKVPGDATLVFSFVGMESQEITVAGKSTINVVMQEKTVGIEEVVAVGYGTQSRRTVTSAVSKFDGKKLESMPINSIGDGLKGKVAGLRMYTTDFQPGEDPSFRIRGGSSINESNAPVIVVDGVVRSISGINPNDIASIEVLKDAASAAIYGAKASNGIILITTKKGSVGKPRISFEASVAYQEPAQHFDLMNAEDYIYTMRLATARGKYPERNFENGNSASTGNDENSMWTTRYLKDGETIPKGYKSMLDPLDNTKTIIFEDNDFQRRFFSPTTWQNYYIGATGGNESVKYTASIGYTDDGGIGIGTGYTRFTMKGNTDFKISKKLSFATGFNYSQAEMEDYPDNKRNVVQRGLFTAPTHKIFNTQTGLPERGTNSTLNTPDWYEYYYDNGQTTKRSTVNAKLTYRFNNNLKAVAMITNHNRHRRSHSFTKANYYNGLRETYEGLSETQRLDLQAYLNYNKHLNNGTHNIATTIGTDYMKDKDDSFSASVTGASSDKVPTLSAGSIPGTPASSRTEEVLISYFGRFNYDYKGKYLFSATMRADGSSKFAQDNRWGYFPAASIGWIMTEENFMAGIGSLSNLKLRASYGRTGNNSIGLYDSYGAYKTSGVYDGNSTIVTSTIPNLNLKWETTNQLDVGFDLGLFRNKIKLNCDYFNKITHDLIFDKPLPNTSGYSSITTNIGKVKFYGFDLEFSSENIKTKNFSWTTDFTYSYVMNKVLKLPDNGNDKNRIDGTLLGDGTQYGGIAEGERMYRLYGYKVDHILETQEEADAAMYDSKSYGFRFSDGKSKKGRKDIGDYEWVNRPGSTQRNGEDQITSEDKFLLGYTVPHTTGGLGNTFTYKNLSLYIFMDYQLGHSIQNAMEKRFFIGTFGYNGSLSSEVKKCWKQPGDDTKYARFFPNDSGDGSRNFYRESDVFIQKGDFLCIREVTLSYRMPARFIKPLGIQNMSFYFSGNNLHYFTAVTGAPPEQGTGSTYDKDYALYPAARKYAIGIKVMF